MLIEQSKIKKILNKNHKLNINLSILISIGILWIYSLNLYPFGVNLSNSTINIVNILIIIIYAYLCSNIDNRYFIIRGIFSNKELLIALVLFLITIVLSWRNLTQPLWGDQVYHSSYSARYSQFVVYFIDFEFPYLFGKIKNIKAYLFLQVINIFLILSIFFVIKIIYNFSKHSKKIYVVGMVIFLLIIKYTTYFLSIKYINTIDPFVINFNSDPHPLLRTLPLFLTSSIFGVSDFGFRMAAYLSAYLFLFILYIKLKKNSNAIFSLISCLLIATLPIFWHVSYLVEPSVWAMLFNSFIFLIIFTIKNYNFKILFSILLISIIFLMMRLSSILGIISISVIIIIQIINKKWNKKEYYSIIFIYSFISLLLFISIYRGSPAVETLSTANKLLYVSHNNIMGIAGVYIIGIAPLLLIGYTFITNDVLGLIRFISVIIFISIAYLIFYGPIAQISWGTSRYQAEIFVPLIVAGICAYSNYAMNSKVKVKTYPIYPLILIILLNIYSLYNFNKRSLILFPNVPTPNESIKSEVEYPLNKAFEYIRINNLANQTYYIGIYYTGFFSILRNFNLEEYLLFSKLNNLYRNGFNVFGNQIDNDKRINALVIESAADYSDIKSNFSKNGWKIAEVFNNFVGNHKIYILLRDK